MNSEFTVAVHGLVLLAQRPDRMATSDMIACSVNTHSARIRRVMGWLKKSGMIATKEGIGGGYVLMGNPEEITLAHVYRILAMGSVVPSWKSGGTDPDCMVATHMEEVMSEVFRDTEMQMMRHLDRVTIADLLAQIRKAADGSKTKPK